MTTWSDISQYQGNLVNDAYPHPVFSFRTNSGDIRDTMGVGNAIEAKRMLDQGKLQIVIAYYFFRPGQANCDLHLQVLKEAGLWGHPALVTMVDVEDGGGAISGDQSLEVNDEVNRIASWYGTRKKVIGYLNAVSNAGLWRDRGGIRFVTPNYTRVPGQLNNVPDWMRNEMFAHQYTDTGVCPPWPRGVDLNYSPLSVEELKNLFGITTSEGDDIVASLSQEQANAVAEGGGQLLRYPGIIRRPSNWLIKFLGKSWNDQEGPRFADAFGAVVNEIVWDGYNYTDEVNGVPIADLPAEQGKNLVTMVRQIGARQARIERKLDELKDLLEGQKK